MTYLAPIIAAIAAGAICYATDTRPQSVEQHISKSIAALSVDEGRVVITFHNSPTNDSSDNGEYALSIDGLTVIATFRWNVAGDDDAITITPPLGYVCEPGCEIRVHEGGSASIELYPLLG